MFKLLLSTLAILPIITGNAYTSSETAPEAGPEPELRQKPQPEEREADEGGTNGDPSESDDEVPAVGAPDTKEKEESDSEGNQKNDDESKRKKKIEEGIDEKTEINYVVKPEKNKESDGTADNKPDSGNESPAQSPATKPSSTSNAAAADKKPESGNENPAKSSTTKPPATSSTTAPNESPTEASITKPSEPSGATANQKPDSVDEGPAQSPATKPSEDSNVAAGAEKPAPDIPNIMRNNLRADVYLAKQLPENVMRTRSDSGDKEVTIILIALPANDIRRIIDSNPQKSGDEYVADMSSIISDNEQIFGGRDLAIDLVKNVHIPTDIYIMLSQEVNTTNNEDNFERYEVKPVYRELLEKSKKKLPALRLEVTVENGSKITKTTLTASSAVREYKEKANEPTVLAAQANKSYEKAKEALDVDDKTMELANKVKELRSKEEKLKAQEERFKKIIDEHPETIKKTEALENEDKDYNTNLARLNAEKQRLLNEKEEAGKSAPTDNEKKKEEVTDAQTKLNAAKTAVTAAQDTLNAQPPLPAPTITVNVAASGRGRNAVPASTRQDPNPNYQPAKEALDKAGAALKEAEAKQEEAKKVLEEAKKAQGSGPSAEEIERRKNEAEDKIKGIEQATVKLENDYKENKKEIDNKYENSELLKEPRKELCEAEVELKSTQNDLESITSSEKYKDVETIIPAIEKKTGVIKKDLDKKLEAWSKEFTPLAEKVGIDVSPEKEEDEEEKATRELVKAFKKLSVLNNEDRN